MWDDPKLLLCVMMIVKSIFQAGSGILFVANSRQNRSQNSEKKNFCINLWLYRIAISFLRSRFAKWNDLQSTKLKEKRKKRERYNVKNKPWPPQQQRYLEATR